MASNSGSYLWHHYYRRNVFLNYLSLFVQLITGIFIFRTLINYFSKEEFGYYVFLWSLLRYVLVIEFGFGFSLQKIVAEGKGIVEDKKITESIVTIFWLFAGIASVLYLLLYFLRPWFLSSLNVSPENIDLFSITYVWFFAGLCLSFPLGLMAEVQKGLQRYDILSSLNIVFSFVGLFFVLFATRNQFSISEIVLTIMILQLIKLVCCTILIRNSFSDFSLSPYRFNLKSISSLFRFSYSIYIIAIAELIILNVDQSVIGFTIGLVYIVYYQIGFKVNSVFQQLSMRMHMVLPTAAAQIRAKKGVEQVNSLLEKSTNLSVFCVIPLFILSVYYLKPLISFITGSQEIAIESVWVGQILLLSTLLTTIFSGPSKKIMIVCGFERKIMILSVVEALLNFTLSVFLVYRFGVVGVAFGTFIASLLVNVFGIIPLTARFVRRSIIQLLGEYFLPVLKPLMLPLAVFALLEWLFPVQPPYEFLQCVGHGVAVGISMLISGKKIYQPLLRWEEHTS